MTKAMKVVLYVLNIAITAFAAEPACSVCSIYHYEEMLLERVLRNELALEQTPKNINETNKNVVDELRKLDDENDKVNTAIKLMERKQILMEATFDDAIKKALTNVSESLSHVNTESGRAIKEIADRVERLKGELQTPTIQFRARLASSITVDTGKIVVFPQVEVNDGQGYDKGTGKFTASVAGLYNCAVQSCTQGSNWVYPEIVQNGKSLLSSGHYGADGASQCYSLQTYVVMSMGDKVWVQTSSTSHFYQHDVHWSIKLFGVLIRA